MPIDLVALLEAVSGISGSIKGGKDLISMIVGKGNEDKELLIRAQKNNEELMIRLEKISKAGWSLNDYHELYDVSFRLNMLGNTIFFNLGNIPPQASATELRYINENLERSYRDLRSEFKIGLSKFLGKAKYLDERDQGIIDFSIQIYNNSFGGADALLQQQNLDYANLRNHIRNIATASEDLVSVAHNKIDLITKTLIGLGK
jgi:hypothetical protein